MDLSLSGESDLFSTVYSGCACLKASSKKSNVADNAKSIRKNGKLASIAEMAVYVLLLGIGRKCSLRRHETIAMLKGATPGLSL